MEKAVFVVKAKTEGSHQAVGSKGRPTHCKHREEDEDGGEGTGLEAHVYVQLEGPLEAQQAQLAGLAQTHAVRVAVDADGVMADGVQDPHERVQHHRKRDEEENQHEDQHIGVVSRVGAVTEDALRGPGRGLQGRGAHS